MSNKFASLYAGLLARKGDATPVFANPTVSYVDTPRPVENADPEIRRDVASAEGLPLIAGKVNGETSAAVAKPDGLSPMKTVTAPAPRKPRRQAATHRHPDCHRLTFRMTSDQRRRLRVAAAQKNGSLQQSLSDALDKYLDGLCACSLKECNCLARRDASSDGPPN